MLQPKADNMKISCRFSVRLLIQFFTYQENNEKERKSEPHLQDTVPYFLHPGRKGTFFFSAYECWM